MQRHLLTETSLHEQLFLGWRIRFILKNERKCPKRMYCIRSVSPATSLPTFHWPFFPHFLSRRSSFLHSAMCWWPVFHWDYHTQKRHLAVMELHCAGFICAHLRFHIISRPWMNLWCCRAGSWFFCRHRNFRPGALTAGGLQGKGVAFEYHSYTTSHRKCVLSDSLHQNEIFWAEQKPLWLCLPEIIFWSKLWLP